VWPANAAYVLERAATAVAGRLRALYDPLIEPGTKLFDPELGVRFGAVWDSELATIVLDEGGHRSFEATCDPEPQTPPFRECTWRRKWARVFAAFNDGQDGSKDRLERYGNRVVERSARFSPQ
jgi:hypothetical protein